MRFPALGAGWLYASRSDWFIKSSACFMIDQSDQN